MQIELVYEKTCPNIEAARRQLLKAFTEAGMTPRWQEWEVSGPDAPQHVHGYGSPTILVNGQDVSGDMPDGDDYCCRVYSHDEHTNKGVPALLDIVKALKSAQQASSKKTYFASIKLNGAMFPAVGVALLPKLACPACWPAYAGLLSSLGIGFIDYTPYLFPLSVLFLFIVIVALSYRAKYRHGYRPLMLGLLAATVVLINQIFYESDVAMYTGLTLLVLASLWNTWPKSQVGNQSCSACEPVNQQ